MNFVKDLTSALQLPGITAITYTHTHTHAHERLAVDNTYWKQLQRQTKTTLYKTRTSGTNKHTLPLTSSQILFIPTRHDMFRPPVHLQHTTLPLPLQVRAAAAGVRALRHR